MENTLPPTSTSDRRRAIEQPSRACDNLTNAQSVVPDSQRQRALALIGSVAIQQRSVTPPIPMPTKSEELMLNIPDEMYPLAKRVLNMLCENNIHIKSKEYDKDNPSITLHTIRLLLTNLHFNREYLNEIKKHENSPYLYIGNLVETAIFGNSNMGLLSFIDTFNKDGKQDFFDNDENNIERSIIIPSHLRAEMPAILVAIWKNLACVGMPQDMKSIFSVFDDAFFGSFGNIEADNDKQKAFSELTFNAYQLKSSLTRTKLQIIPLLGKCLCDFKQENNPLKLHFDDNNHLEATTSNIKKILTFFLIRMIEDKTKCIAGCHEEKPTDLKALRFYFNTDDEDDSSRFLDIRESHKDLDNPDGLLSFFEKQFESLGLSVSVSDGFYKLEKTLKIAQMIFCKTDLFPKNIRDLMVSCQFAFNLSYACFLYDNDMRLGNNILSGPAYLSVATTCLGKSNRLYFSKPCDNNPAVDLNWHLISEISAFSDTTASRIEQLGNPASSFNYNWMFSNPLIDNSLLAFYKRYNKIVRCLCQNPSNCPLNFSMIAGEFLKPENYVSDSDKLCDGESPGKNIKYLVEHVIDMSMQPPQKKMLQ